MKKQSKLLKTFNLIKDIICWALLAFLVIMIIIFLMAKISGDDASVFGYSIYRVQTGSMEPEIEIGDVILDKAVDDPFELKIGDVVTYAGSGQLTGKNVTHEVIKAPYTNEEGIVMLQTKGIANDLPDAEIPAGRVKAVMICKIPILDVFYNVFFSPWGLIIFVLLIVFIFFGDIVNFVRAAGGLEKSAKDGEDINESLQAEKREELKKQLEEKAKLAAEASQKPETEADVTDNKD